MWVVVITVEAKKKLFFFKGLLYEAEAERFFFWQTQGFFFPKSKFSWKASKRKVTRGSDSFSRPPTFWHWIEFYAAGWVGGRWCTSLERRFLPASGSRVNWLVDALISCVCARFTFTGFPDIHIRLASALSLPSSLLHCGRGGGSIGVSNSNANFLVVHISSLFVAFRVCVPTEWSCWTKSCKSNWMIHFQLTNRTITRRFQFWRLPWLRAQPSEILFPSRTVLKPLLHVSSNKTDFAQKCGTPVVLDSFSALSWNAVVSSGCFKKALFSSTHFLLQNGIGCWKENVLMLMLNSCTSQQGNNRHLKVRSLQGKEWAALVWFIHKIAG